MPIFPETLENLEKGTVQELNLAPYSITREDVQTIIRVLPQNTSMKAIILGTCQFDRELLEAFAEVLKHHPSIMELSLGQNNDIGDHGAKAMASVLMHSKSLASLHMCKAGIGDMGIRALVRALKDNYVLNILDLSDNKITDDGAAVLAEVFKGNFALTRLKLDGNRIGYAGITALTKALTGNQTLVEFTMMNNKATEDLTAGIEKAFEQSLNIINLKISGSRVIDACHKNKQAVMQMLEKLQRQPIHSLPPEDIRQIKDRVYSIAYVAEQDLRVPRYKVLDLLSSIQKTNIRQAVAV
jgi:Ran GTPase-activating protein (RanGAP) involved in mRNA processing and transport